MSFPIHRELEKFNITGCVLLLPSVMLCQENRESCFVLTVNAFSHQIKLCPDWFPSVSQSGGYPSVRGLLEQHFNVCNAPPVNNRLVSPVL